MALRLREFGRAIDVFDLSGIFGSPLIPMRPMLFIYTYALADEFIYGIAYFTMWVKRMATQILSRKQRGEKIASEDVVQINPQAFSSGPKAARAATVFHCFWASGAATASTTNTAMSNANTSTPFKPKYRRSVAVSDRALGTTEMTRCPKCSAQHRMPPGDARQSA